METTARSADTETLDRIVEAARECFRSRGVRATRMAHVAGRAGMVRQTVYRFVSGRDQLLELAFTARLNELQEVVAARIDPSAGALADSLTEAMAAMTEVTRDDPECAEIIRAMSPANAFRFMTGPSPAQEPSRRALEPFYERARAEKVLRPGLTLEETAWWARMFLSPLTARPDLSPGELRELIRRFALPALLVDA